MSSVSEAIADLKSASIDRLPPHSSEAEQGVLGCILLDPNNCLPEVISKFKGETLAFYDLRHQTIYESLVKMFEAREQIDLITLQQSLKDQQLLEQVGGIVYLSQLQDAVPSAANLSYYTEIAWEKYILRRVVAACSGVVGKVYDYEGEVEQLLDEVERELMTTTQLRVSGASHETKSILARAMQRIENRFNTKGEPTGLLTGMPVVDRMLDGLHGGEMIIIAARPSLGKSSLMMNWAEHMAIESGVPVGVFSLEMSSESLIERTVGSLARVNIREAWNMSESDFAKVNTAQSRIHHASKLLQIDDTASLSILELRARARRMVQQHGIRCIFIDYLQLLHGTSKKAKDSRQVEISEISQGLKALAKELNIPVVVLSQLNRELEKNKRKPRTSDLRESGSLEQDADVIGLLSQDVDEDGEVIILDGGSIQANLEIAKQRNGPTGDVKLEFFKTETRFASLSQFAGDVPESKQHKN